MPVMMHLAGCEECAARYERLERKLREAASCEVERPETFWSRQRHLVMRKIDSRRDNVARIIRTTRIAAAAAFAFFLGGAVMYKTVEPEIKAPTVTVVSTAQTRTQTTKTDDPWQSDELKEFHSVVQWESWVDTKNGDQL
jgi:anti-sigma factor RsiW